MENNNVISVEQVSKKFCQGYKNIISYGISDITSNFFNLNKDKVNLRPNEFFALRHINFSLKKGQILGIIGRNGSGKSTLLKLLTGIYLPDEGKIIVNGTVGALIGAGSGFHQMLTGRENIYLSGTIFGMKKKEIDSKFEEIVDFSGIREFLDSPVKNYSSGMHARLGFAINILCNPYILIIDEVLAVGDIEFRKKCLERLDMIIKNHKTLIFVSHLLDEIRRLCNVTLWLEHGKQMAFGETENVINQYLNFIKNETKKNSLSSYK